MKRIVNGHYADTDSTRDLVDINEEEFMALKFAITQHRRKFEMMINFTDGQLIEQINNLKRDKSSGDFQKQVLESFTPQTVREEMKADVRSIALVNAKIVLLEAKKEITPITGIALDQYRVLIDAVRYTCADINDAINTAIELQSAVQKANNEQWENEMNHKMKVLYGILKDINQPYEGATYLDKNGEEADTSEYFTKQKSSADVN